LKRNNNNILGKEISQNKLFDKEYEIIEELGKGGSGQTYKVRARKNKNIFRAVKHIEKRSKLFQKTNVDIFKKTIMNEITIQYNVGNRFIAKSLGYFCVGKDNFALLQELMENGNLTEYINRLRTSFGHIKRNGFISESFVGYIAYHTVMALKHLYYLDVIHQDIKLDNLVINRDHEIKLSDFTISIKLNLGCAEFQFQGHGTTCFISYENLKKMKVPLKESHKNDYYALGVLIYKLLFGCYPFGILSKDTKDEIIKKMEQTNPITFPKDIKVSKQVKELLLLLLEYDYKKRINLEELCVHPWMNIFSSLSNIRNMYQDQGKFMIDLFLDNVESISKQLIYD